MVYKYKIKSREIKNIIKNKNIKKIALMLFIVKKKKIKRKKKLLN